MTQFDIKVVSDTICPWCYIGKQKLEEAIVLYQQQHPGSSDTFSLSWTPYYINPNLPVRGKLHLITLCPYALAPLFLCFWVEAEFLTYTRY
jgi:predicted DsbA family dithiol-disulfide isomerase